jgi:hypothetical protein
MVKKGRISDTIMVKYLNAINKKYESDLDMDEVKKVFMLVLKDYRNEEIFLEELSGICNYLHGMAEMKSMSDQKLSNFSNLLLHGAEINFYLSHADKEESGKIAMSHLRDILNYKED